MSRIIEREMLSLFKGVLLGQGSTREVYSVRCNTNLVLKVESKTQSFQNIMEWETWREVMGTKWEKWFAPCIEISPCGIAMIQERTEPMAACDLPNKMPSFFTDLQYANFGRIGKQIVAHDYGLGELMRNDLKNARMIETDPKNWRHPND